MNRCISRIRRDHGGLAVLALGVGFFPAAFGGCTSAEDSRTAVGTNAESATSFEELSHGYALLYELLAKERHVTKILWVKFERDEVEGLMEDIARTADSAYTRIERFAENGSRIRLEDTGLPLIETEVREAIESTTTDELLAASGRRFEVLLVLTQLESLRYASHLARVLAERDPVAERGEFLSAFEKRIEQLRHRALDLLGGGVPFEAE